MEKTPMGHLSQVFKHSFEKQIHSSDKVCRRSNGVCCSDGKHVQVPKRKKIRNHCFYSKKMNGLQSMFLRIQEQLHLN